MRVAITGATGFVGRALLQTLIQRGDEVLILTRRPAAARQVLGETINAVQWTPKYTPSWGQQVALCDAVINLAGEPIFGRRWTAKQKERILRSRTEAAAGIIEAIRQADRPPRVLINASAIGYYGPHGDELLDESSPPGEDFLAQVCRAWEEAVETGQSAGFRIVRIRTGIVLGAEGGALKRMLPAFKMFVGGRFGSGRQWMSWIHIEDLVRLYLWALDNSMAEGPLNGTAPNPVSNREFSQLLGRVLRRPSLFPVPAFVARAIFGEAAQVILSGQRVLPRRCQELGFAFRFPRLEEALRKVLRPS